MSSDTAKYFPSPESRAGAMGSDTAKYFPPVEYSADSYDPFLSVEELNQQSGDAITSPGGRSVAPVFSRDKAKELGYDDRESAIVDRHLAESGGTDTGYYFGVAKADMEIAARRQQRAYADEASLRDPDAYIATTKMLLSTGRRSEQLDVYRKMTPEQREEALRLAPGIAQQLGDDRGGAVMRTIDAVSRGVSGFIQSGMEVLGAGGTQEEIDYLRKLNSASQEFAPARPDDPWYQQGALQAAEMAPPMVMMGMAGRLGGAVGTAAGTAIGRAAAAGVPGAKAAFQAAGAVGKVPTAVGLKGVTTKGVFEGIGSAAGVTAASWAPQYVQEKESLKELGMKDGAVLRTLAGTTAAAVGLIESIVPNPWKAGNVSIKDGVMKAVRQYVWQASKNLPGEINEEGLQGVTSGLGEYVAQYLDKDVKKKSVGEAFSKGWQQASDSVLPLVFMLGAPGVAGATSVAIRARREQLEQLRSKGFVSKEDAKRAGIEVGTRKEMAASVDAEIEDLKARELVAISNESDAAAESTQAVAPPDVSESDRRFAEQMAGGVNVDEFGEIIPLSRVSPPPVADRAEQQAVTGGVAPDITSAATAATNPFEESSALETNAQKPPVSQPEVVPSSANPFNEIAPSATQVQQPSITTRQYSAQPTLPETASNPFEVPSPPPVQKRSVKKPPESLSQNPFESQPTQVASKPPAASVASVEQNKQVQGEIVSDVKQFKIFKDGKWRDATVTAVNEGEAGWRVKHVKITDPETGRYEYVPFPMDAAKGYGSYEQARDEVLSALQQKYGAEGVVQNEVVAQKRLEGSVTLGPTPQGSVSKSPTVESQAPAPAKLLNRLESIEELNAVLENWSADDKRPKASYSTKELLDLARSRLNDFSESGHLLAEDLAGDNGPEAKKYATKQRSRIKTWIKIAEKEAATVSDLGASPQLKAAETVPPSEPAAPSQDVIIGERLTIAGKPAVRSSSVTDQDNVRYELFKDEDAVGGTIRSTDMDSGNVVFIRTYQDFEKARKEYGKLEDKSKPKEKSQKPSKRGRKSAEESTVTEGTAAALDGPQETSLPDSSIRKAIEDNGGYEKNSADDVEAVRRKLYDGENTPTHADIRSVMQDMKNEAGGKATAAPETEEVSGEQPDIGRGYRNFISGAQSSPSDIESMLVTSDRPIGISVQPRPVSQRVKDAVVMIAERGRNVFLDSGIATTVNSGKTIDFDKVFDQYEAIIDLVRPMFRSRIFVVAPDIITQQPDGSYAGNQEGTYELQEKYQGRIAEIQDMGATVIVPFPRGERDLTVAFADVSDFVNFAAPNAFVGIPYKYNPWSDEQILNLVKSTKESGDLLKIHLFGGGSAKVAAMTEKIHAINPDVAVTGDSASDLRNKRNVLAITPKSIRKLQDKLGKARETGTPEQVSKLEKKLEEIKDSLFEQRVAEGEKYTITVVGCCDKKASSRSPAKDLYQSTLYKKSADYAEEISDDWMIASAEYGLVDPGKFIDPYDRKMGGSKAEKERMAGMLTIQNEFPAASKDRTSSVRVVILAGQDYANAVKANIPAGVEIVEPLKGMEIGERLQWLSKKNKSLENETIDDAKPSDVESVNENETSVAEKPEPIQKEVIAEPKPKQKIADERAAERVEKERDELVSARKKSRDYFQSKRVSNALKSLKIKAVPVMVRQEKESGDVKVVDGKITSGDKKGELYTNGLLLHQSFAEDDKDFVLTHSRSGIAIPYSAKKGEMKELVGLFDLLGVDFNVDVDSDNRLPKDLVARVQKIIKAWRFDDYSVLDKEDRATVEVLADSAKTDIEADLILTADDLGDNGVPLGKTGVMTDRGSKVVREMAISVPEFAYDPVFTFQDGKLVYRDGHVFRFEPKVFNLHPSELKEGQTVGINLEDMGIKRSTPQDVVAAMLKNAGFTRVTKSSSKRSITAGYIGTAPASIQQGDKDNEWDVVGGSPKAREIAISVLKRIRWRQPGQDGNPNTELEVNGKDVGLGDVQTDKGPSSDTLYQLSNELRNPPKTLFQTEPDIDAEFRSKTLKLGMEARKEGITRFDDFIAYSLRTIGEMQTRALGAYLKMVGEDVGMEGVRPVRDILGVPMTREQYKKHFKKTFTGYTDEQIDVLDRIPDIVAFGRQEIGFAPAGVSVPEQGLMQSVSIRSGREKLKKYGLNPNETHLVRDVAAALEARQRAKYGYIDKADRSPEAKKKIAMWMVEEVLFEMDNPENSGVGWYSTKFQAALDTLGEIFPELLTDQNARDIMTVLIAVTSDGQKVMGNTVQAVDIYENFKKSGKFVSSVKHNRMASINGNLMELQKLYDKLGPAAMRDYLMQEDTISNLRKIARESGGKLDTGYLKHVKMPLAAVALGPKLGAFYANLMGSHGYLTMDRWWSRTFNRYRGILLTSAGSSAMRNFADLTGRPEMSDDEVLAAVVGPRGDYLKRGYKSVAAILAGKSEPSKNSEKEKWMSGLQAISSRQSLDAALEKAALDIEKKSQKGKLTRIEIDEDGFEIEVPVTKAEMQRIADDLRSRIGSATMDDLLLEHRVERSANSIYKDAFEKLHDAPFNASDRTFMLDAANKAQEILKRKGHDLSIADIQAILWYYEKKLYGELGARQSGKISYEEAAKEVKTAKEAGLDIWKLGSESDRGDKAEVAGTVPVGEEVYQPKAGRLTQDEASGVGADSTRKALVKKDLKNVNWSRLSRLGETLNPSEAGYIKPDGSLADFSGKQEGGQPGTRSFDHREAGGTAGMQEVIAYGWVRMDENSGSLDIAKMPTPAQLSAITKMANRKIGEIVLDLEDGLGEFRESDGYYANPRRRWSQQYPEGTKPQRIVNDIKKFFSGDTPNTLYQQDTGTRRIDMNYKDVTKRIPQLTEAAQKLKDGEITREEYASVVDRYKEVTPYEFVPEPAAVEDAKRALSGSKFESYGDTAESIPDGYAVELRLDIPAYKDHGVWINSIHRKVGDKQITQYDSYAYVADVNFIQTPGSQRQALDVARGAKSKGPFARIEGKWRPTTKAQAVAMAEEALKSPSWTQVGYDPERHGYFYDRFNHRLILESADEVIQIGPLVLAKNPVYSEESPLFQNQGQGEDVRGWTQFISATRAVIGATSKANVSTFIHEFAHPMRRFLLDKSIPQDKRADITDEEISMLEEKCGAGSVIDGKWVTNWDVEAEEKFARMWEQYWFEGKSPNTVLDSLFEKISRWMQQVYNSIKEITGGELDQDVRDLFDKLVQRGLPADQRTDRKSADKTRTDSLPTSSEWEERLTSIANAVATQIRLRAGLGGLTEPARETFEEWLDDAARLLAADPSLGERLVKELSQSNRNISNTEVAVLQIHFRHLNNLMEGASDRLFKAKEANDSVAAAKARLETDMLVNQLEDFTDITKRAGTEAGRALVARRIALQSDFTLGNLLRVARIANAGESLNREQRNQIEELANKVAKLEGDLAKEIQKNDDLARQSAIKQEIEGTKKEVGPPVRNTATNRAVKTVEKFVSRFTSIFGKRDDTETLQQTEDEQMAEAGEEVIRSFVDAGVYSFGEFIAKFKDVIKGEVPVAARVALRKAWDKMKSQGDIPAPEIADERQTAELRRLAKMVQRELVEFGITDPDDVIDGVHEALQEVFEDVTRREAMDAMSGYGQYSALNPEPNAAIIRDLNGQYQQMAKLDDMRQGMAPKKTGGERRTPSPEERELIQQVNQMKKDSKYFVTDPETQLKTIFQATRTALRNRIYDLSRAINVTEKAIVGRSGVDFKGEEAEEIAAYRKLRDELMDEYKQMFPKPGLTFEQRAALAERAAYRAIAEIERQLKSGDVSPKVRPEPVSTPTLDAKRKRLEALRAQRDAVRDMQKPKLTKEERDEKAYIANLLSRIADYEDRIRSGYFSSRPKKAPRTLSPKEIELSKQLESVKDDFFRYAAEYRLRNMSRVERAWDYARETMHLSRAIMTSFDLSAVFRQGGIASLAHPRLAAASSRQMWNALWRSSAEFDTMDKISKDDLYALAMRAGLSITTDSGKITRQEEAYMGRWAKWGIGKKGTKINTASQIALIPVAASARAYTTFLNSMRFQVFKYMVSNLGSGGQVTLEEAKVIASYVNAATGRAELGKFNQAAANLNTVFFAPRYVASRFQYLAMPFYLLPSTKVSGRVKKMIAMEYARHVTGLAAFLGLSVALASLLTDDEEEKPTVEFDPRSSDWMKLKIGETRIDPMAGLSQTVTLIGQLGTGQKKKLSGEIQDLYGEKRKFGDPDLWDVTTGFLRKKLAPIPGAIVDLRVGENVIGEKETPFTVATDLFVPLSMQEAGETMKARGLTSGLAITALSLLGMGGGTYGPRTQYATANAEKRSELFKKELARTKWDSPEPVYKDFLNADQVEQFRKQKEQRKQAFVYSASATPDRRDYGSDETFSKSVSERDEALGELIKSGMGYEEIRQLLIAYYKRNYGSAFETRNGVYGMKQSLALRLRFLRRKMAGNASAR